MTSEPIEPTACKHPARAWVDYTDLGHHHIQRCSDCGAWRGHGDRWEDIPPPTSVLASPFNSTERMRELEAALKDIRARVRPHAKALTAPDPNDGLDLCRSCMALCDRVDELAAQHVEVEDVRAAARRLASYWRVQCDGEESIREMFRAEWSKRRKIVERERDDALERVRELEARIGDMRG